MSDSAATINRFGQPAPPSAARDSDPRPQVEPATFSLVWTLRRESESMRCVLYAIGRKVELRIESTLAVAISQRCADLDQAKTMASAWRSMLEDRGWAADPDPIGLVKQADQRRRADC